MDASSSNNVDPSQYPLGFNEASTIDPAFGDDQAALIITAVGKNSPPVAVRKMQLNKLKFPYVFELTVDDLMFPYNTDIWLKSPLSQNSLSITCILDKDGSLITPSNIDRFGFAISDPISVYKGTSVVVVNDDKNKEVLTLPDRLDAKISINLKSDGHEYSKEELELLSRVQNEIERLNKST